MIPTQPGIPNPFDNNTTWRPPNYNQSWQCPFCNQWIGNMQFHNCQGQTIPTEPVRALEPLQSGGIMSDFMMYGDFKKLMRRDTLATFKEAFILKLTESEVTGIEDVADVFDDVAKDVLDSNLV